MNDLRYRFARAADAPLLARLNAQLIAAGADFGPADQGLLEQRMQRWLNSGRDHAVLFEDGHGCMLAYAVYREDATEIYLRQFLVLDAARHHGIGRRAFALLRQEIWSRGKRLTLEVLSGNRAGLRFWRALGYRDCAVTLEIPGCAPASAPEPAKGAKQRLRCSVALLLASLVAMPAAALPSGQEDRPARLLAVSFQPAPHTAPALAAAWPAAAPTGAAAAPDHDVPDAAQLLALRGSGAYCAASIYRSAWSMARAYGMEPAWVMAMIEAESSCRSDARSRTGALGLMQLMPGGAREAWRLAYGAELPGNVALRDPQTNIRLGVIYLRQLHRHFAAVGSGEARLLLSVAAYNCGADLFDGIMPEAAAWNAADAERWIGQHAPRETRGYVSRVRTQARRYAAALLSRGAP